MLRNLAWQASDQLARAQFMMFQTLAEQINLTPDDRRRTLNLDLHCWAAWMAFLQDGPLPAEPALPDLLRRMADTAFNLSLIAERRAGPASPEIYPGSAPAR